MAALDRFLKLWILKKSKLLRTLWQILLPKFRINQISTRLSLQFWILPRKNMKIMSKNYWLSNMVKALNGVLRLKLLLERSWKVVWSFRYWLITEKLYIKNRHSLDSMMIYPHKEKKESSKAQSIKWWRMNRTTSTSFITSIALMTKVIIRHPDTRSTR